MTDPRPWYREPETFIAIAALVVSVSAVVVGLYEATLQRRHDRAEVWPHLEIATFTKNRTGAVVYLENTGIGPAIVKRIVVGVDSTPAHGWSDVLSRVFGSDASLGSNTTVLNHGLRPGDRVTLVEMNNLAVTTEQFWPAIRRVRITVCYASVFDEFWTVSAALGGELVWNTARGCDAQPRGISF